MLNLSRAQASSRWCGSQERGSCQLRCRPRHLTMVQNYEAGLHWHQDANPRLCSAGYEFATVTTRLQRPLNKREDSPTRGLLATDLGILNQSSDEDDTRAGTSSPKFHTNGRTFTTGLTRMVGRGRCVKMVESPESKLVRLGKRKQVCLQGIPSHVGVPGNEVADELADRGCEIPNPSSTVLTH
ncbi:hypothetical protein TNCV_1657871 [Trichonephila clavipes]|nr:hypothetical protein TNCV_1657871 [Trichonephila clavipes]